MDAWLMAVTLQGMTDEETHQLTMLMLHSGLVMDFSEISKPKVDKHSTGGVGDKTTLVLGPIVSACGLVMPTIAGRGLGHTGGTLDKLESIPGFVTRLDSKKFRRILEQEGLCFMGQTDEICPADKKIYSLRDVTSTIESLPLICASIMSKKLAEGIDSLVLDVKAGTGAFMKTEDEAIRLAQDLKAIGERAGKKVTALITNMDEPLGTWVGNAVEVRECMRIMQNQTLTPREVKTKELSLAIAAHMLLLSHITDNFADAYHKAEESILNGNAFRVFEKVCHAHGGDLAGLPTAKYSFDVVSPDEGFISMLNCEEVGNAAILLRAGRRTVSDQLDPAAGIQIHKSLSDKVEKGEPLFTLYSEDKNLFSDCSERLLGALRISDQRPALKPLILRTLE
jgi:pyrimidine-nucleoside phosphorylase